MMTKGELATKLSMIATSSGVACCKVDEFKPAEYKGLRSGIGKQRRSSKHFGCKDKCCAFGPHTKVKNNNA